MIIVHRQQLFNVKPRYDQASTITNNLLNEGQYFDDALPSCLLFGLLTLFPSEKDIISAVAKLLSCHSIVIVSIL